MSYLLRQELICLDSRPWYKPQRRSAIRPSCRNVHGAAIGQFHSRITVANGPNQTFVYGAANGGSEPSMTFVVAEAFGNKGGY